MTNRTASVKGRIHSAGYTDDPAIVWKHMAPQDQFLEAMADAAGTVIKMSPAAAI